MTIHKSGIVSLMVVIGMVLAGCGGGSKAIASHSDQLLPMARQILNKSAQGRTILDQPAAERQVTNVLRPLESVESQERRDTLDIACQALNMYQLGQVDSLETGVDWVSSQGSTTGARRQAALQLAEALNAVRKRPTLFGATTPSGEEVPGGVEVTASAFCSVQQ
jgi:hypothetical protein